MGTMTTRRVWTGVFTGAALFLSSVAWGYSSGPPNGLTNAPGEGNCTACHGSFGLNSGTGTLEIVGLPTQYTPTSTYQLEVRLSDPSAQRWGFEFTIIDSEGASVGSLTPVDSRTQISTGGALARTYAKHTSVGTNPGQTGQNSWLVDWQAPASGGGDLNVFLVGNAANGNGSTSGDRIYAASFLTTEQSLSGVPSGILAARMERPYPNPFNPRTVIGFSITQDMQAVLSIYNVRGEMIQRLHNGPVSAGTHSFVWQGVDGTGRAQPSGLYLARLTDGRGRDLAVPVKMTLAR